MKTAFTLIVFVLLAANIYGQESDLLGNWILERTQFSNGENLEINNPIYSTKLTFLITSDSLQILSQVFKANFTKSQIKTPFRTINYVLKDGYLITQDENDDKISFFLRPENFVKKHPEFALTESIRNGDTIYIANNITDYVFENELSFDNFIDENRSKNDRPSKSFKNVYFRIEFVLTKDNEIKDIKVLDSIDLAYDNDYIFALKQSAAFLKNLTNRDLLITKEVNQLKWYKDLTDSNEIKLYDLRTRGLEFYHLNNFEKAIQHFSQIKNLTIINNRFKTLIKESMIKLAVSYLAVGNLEEACKTFNQIGSTTDFEIRNYLIDYCLK